MTRHESARRERRERGSRRNWEREMAEEEGADSVEKA